MDVLDGPALQVAGCSVSRSGQTVLHEISFELAPGEWLALLGPNGCGKTTLLATLDGRLSARAGQVCVAGFKLVEERVEALARLGSVLAPQMLPGLLTARQCLDLTAAARGLAGPGEELGLLARRLQLVDLDLPVARHSLGMRQKLAVLLALIGDPALLLLDETFASLDLSAQQVLAEALQQRQQRGCAIVMASHDLDLVARLASRMLLLDNGHVSAALAGPQFRAACDAGLANTLTRLLEDTQ